MLYKSFKDNIKLSRLGMGAMRLPIIGNDFGKIDYERAKVIIDKCMENGVNYFDTAYPYHRGKSEEFLAWALKDYPRESYFLADKFNFQANPDFKEQFSQQLQRLDTDYIDFYLLHELRDDFCDEMLSGGCMEYFDKMKKEGKIRNFGFSFHSTPEKLREVLEIYPWDFVLLQINYYDWYYGNARELYEIASEAGVPVMVMEPVHGGMLANLNDDAAEILKSADSGRSQASWAMRFVMSLDNVFVVLSGMSDDTQAEDNLMTFSQGESLSEKEHELIRLAAEKQHLAVAVACTGCKYCCPVCPAGLDIPMLLNAYNDGKLGGAWRLSWLSVLPEDKQPTACIECGVCRTHCPQGFDIPTYMKELEAMYEEC